MSKSETDPKFFVLPGHFYSPIPDVEEAKKHLNRVEALQAEVKGIDIDDTALTKFWNNICDISGEMPFPEDRDPAYRYYYNNDQFSYGDAKIYYGMLKQYAPKRIIEIGSGYSSALALDTATDFAGDTQMTFVEPYPDRLKRLLRGDDLNVEIIEDKVQHVDFALFEQLEKDDFLIIDSSHVVKTGSDVCFEIFEILPRLQKGVHVMIHDIFFPFEYPKSWILEDQRAWNEAYLVRAFLMYNSKFRVSFFNHYFTLKYPKRVKSYDERFAKSCGGSLWLQVC